MINAYIPLSAELKLEKKMKIRVEPGIFEWTKWEAGKTAPTLMTPEELKEASINVSTEYRYAVRPCPAPRGRSPRERREEACTQEGALQRGSQQARDMGLTPSTTRVQGWWVENSREWGRSC